MNREGFRRLGLDPLAVDVVGGINGRLVCSWRSGKRLERGLKKEVNNAEKNRKVTFDSQAEINL
jgi:hypothetical protein